MGFGQYPQDNSPTLATTTTKKKEKKSATASLNDRVVKTSVLCLIKWMVFSSSTYYAAVLGAVQI